MTHSGARKRKKLQTIEIFFVPAVLSGTMVVGLLAALLGDGVWDAVSWISLSIPLAVLAWHAGVRPLVR